MSEPMTLERGLWRPHLRTLVKYERENGKFWTVLQYRPLSEKAIDLNYDIPSILGPVDVDWMMCLAAFSRFKGISWLVYRGSKRFWNAIDPRTNSGVEIALALVAPWLRALIQKDRFRKILNSQLYAPPHLNAHHAAHQWMSTDTTLERIFQPALKL